MTLPLPLVKGERWAEKKHGFFSVEREMGDRGSKSDSKISVKEQRVDDNWHKRSSFVFKVYSNGFWKKQSSQNPFLVNKRQIINSIPKRDLEFTRSFSTVPQVTKLPCWWVAGFVDAEGCFRISIIKNKNYKGNPFLPSIYSENNGLGATMPLSVRLYFQIGLHLKDEKILNLIQSTYFFFNIFIYVKKKLRGWKGL